jgi:hypothetical protein
MSPSSVLTTSMTKSDLAKLCEVFGSSLTDDLKGFVGPDNLPLDGAKTLWAMAGRESSFGANMKPRHEPAYDVGGSLWKRSPELRQGIALYGRDFACSYGPLQIMAINAKGYSVEDLGNPVKALSASAARLRLGVIPHLQNKTLAGIGDAWNTGNDKDKIVPVDYIKEVTEHYLSGMPA